MVKLVVVLALVACQGNRDAGPGSAASGVDPSRPEGGTPIALGPEAGIPDDTKSDDPDPTPDPGKLIAELGAIPAWQAVTDRAQLLGRRNQRGVVYGRIGPPILMAAPAADPAAGGNPAGSAGRGGGGPGIDGGVTPDAGMVPSQYVWLVDDTEGNGALGIRVALGSKQANTGDRVALGGAWHLDAERRWYWKVETVQSVPPPPPTDLKDPPWPEPTHAIPNGNLPQGARTITVSRDGDAIYFQLVGPTPASEGDGWLVANELGDTPFALLTFPGERASYGGQDMRAADERWQLKKAQTYWVRIGKIVVRPDKPALMRARTGPVRVN